VRIGKHLVRDEGVAGSNPATPTRCSLVPPIFHNYLSAIVVVSKAPRVHSRVHRRELRMASLTQDRNGPYEARICVRQARERLLHGAASPQRGL
jgi:hypothetical protein